METLLPMMDKDDITKLLAEVYMKYSLIYADKMQVISGMTESLRPQLLEKDPYYVWDFINLDAAQYRNDICIKILAELRQRFNELMIQRKIEKIEEMAAVNHWRAMKMLRQAYAEAVVYLREDFLSVLSKHYFSFYGEKPGWILTCNRLQDYITQGRYVESYPFFIDIAGDWTLDAEIRSIAESTCGEIVLYYFPYWPAAEKHFLNAITLSHKSIRAQRGMGQYHKKCGNLVKAREIFLENIVADPHDYRSYNFMGDCFFDESMQVNKNPPKPNEDSNINSENPKVIEWMNKIRQNDGNAERLKLSNEEFWYNAGWNNQFLQGLSCRRLMRYYARDKDSHSKNEGRIAELIEEVSKLSWFPHAPAGLFSDPKYSGCFKDMSRYNTQVAMGNQYLKISMIENANQCYNDAIEQEPHFFSAYLGRAYMYLKIKEIEKAQKDFNKILELDENNYEGYWGLAYLCELKKDMKGAISMYQKCIDIRPEWSDWIENFLGNLHYDFDKIDTAIQYYRKAAEKNQQFKLYTDNLWNAINHSAQHLLKNGKLDEAMEVYKDLARERNLASDWGRLGKMYAENSNYEQAEYHYIKATHVDPEDANIYEELASVYEKMGQLIDYKETLEKAISVNKIDGRSSYKMGIFLLGERDSQSALICFGEALQKEPNNHLYLKNIASCFENYSSTLVPPDGFLEKVLTTANIELDKLEFQDFVQMLIALKTLYNYNRDLSFSHIASWFAKFYLKEPAEKDKLVAEHLHRFLDWLIEHLNQHYLELKSLSQENVWYLTAMIVQFTAVHHPSIVNPTLVAMFFNQDNWAEEANLLVTNYIYLPSDRTDDVIASIGNFARSPFHIVYLSTLKSIVKLSVGDLMQFDLDTDKHACYIEFDFDETQDRFIIENYNYNELSRIYQGFEFKTLEEVFLKKKKYIRKWWSVFEQVLSYQAAL